MVSIVGAPIVSVGYLVGAVWVSGAIDTACGRGGRVRIAGALGVPEPSIPPLCQCAGRFFGDGVVDGVGAVENTGEVFGVVVGVWGTLGLRGVVMGMDV
jgi:hypothetical protein